MRRHGGVAAQHHRRPSRRHAGRVVAVPDELHGALPPQSQRGQQWRRQQRRRCSTGSVLLLAVLAACLACGIVFVVAVLRWNKSDRCVHPPTHTRIHTRIHLYPHIVQLRCDAKCGAHASQELQSQLGVKQGTGRLSLAVTLVLVGASVVGAQLGSGLGLVAGSVLGASVVLEDRHHFQVLAAPQRPATAAVNALRALFGGMLGAAVAAHWRVSLWTEATLSAMLALLAVAAFSRTLLLAVVASLAVGAAIGTLFSVPLCMMLGVTVGVRCSGGVGAFVSIVVFAVLAAPVSPGEPPAEATSTPFDEDAAASSRAGDADAKRKVDDSATDLGAICRHLGTSRRCGFARSLRRACVVDAVQTFSASPLDRGRQYRYRCCCARRDSWCCARDSVLLMWASRRCCRSTSVLARCRASLTLRSWSARGSSD